MHLTDVSVGALGSFAVVGAHLPFACGTALARPDARHRRGLAVLLRRRGDQHRRLPRGDEPGLGLEAAGGVRVREQPLRRVLAAGVARRPSSASPTGPRATRWPAAQVDGNDVLAVRDAVAGACAQARAGDGPTFLEALTYRHMGHSRSRPGAYRPPGELDRWRERDPITLFEERAAAGRAGAARPARRGPRHARGRRWPTRPRGRSTGPSRRRPSASRACGRPGERGHLPRRGHPGAGRRARGRPARDR